MREGRERGKKSGLQSGLCSILNAKTKKRGIPKEKIGSNSVGANSQVVGNSRVWRLVKWST